jgi:t-SNARE complex subunit (syntaxin)
MNNMTYLRNNDEIYFNMESITWCVDEYNLAYKSMRKVWKRKMNYKMYLVMIICAVLFILVLELIERKIYNKYPT